MLPEIVGADCAGIFRLVGYRGPYEAVFVASCSAEIIDSQIVRGSGCLSMGG